MYRDHPKKFHNLTKVAAAKFIPIVTELDGSSPMILFDDMDIDEKLIAYIADRRFRNAGQACDAVKRLIVHERVFDKVVEKLPSYISKLKVGDASDEATEIGPLIAEHQVKLIESQVNDSVKQGAKQNSILATDQSIWRIQKIWYG